MTVTPSVCCSSCRAPPAASPFTSTTCGSWRALPAPERASSAQLGVLAAPARIAEGLDVSAHGVGQGDEDPVDGTARGHAHVLPGPERAPALAGDDPGEIRDAVARALPHVVRPQDGGVVEESPRPLLHGFHLFDQ